MASENEPTKSKASADSSSLKAKLQQHLEAARKRLEGVNQDIASLREEDKEAIRAKVAEVRQRMASQQERAEELRGKASDWVREKSEQGEAEIQSWRERRQVKRLQHRADRAEEYAVDALVMAMIDADEAEAAMLDAFEARLDVDAAIESSK